MSITSRINEMSSHIEQAYDELQGLGADLTNVNKNIDNIASVLDDIYDSLPSVSGEGTSLTLDDTRVGKIKSTLKGNTSQTTYSGKNLLPNDTETKTRNGITITKNSDGTYKVNGTATSDVSEAICNSFIPMSGTWRMLGCPSGGSASTYMLSAYVGYWGEGSPNIDTGNGTNITYTGNVKVRFYIKSGTTCNNLIFKPMLTTDTTATIGNFEPYVGGTTSPNPSYPQPVNVVSGDNEIVVNGKNLITFNNLVGRTWQGVNISYNNSEIIMNGTTAGDGQIIPMGSDLNITLPAGTYTMSYKFGSGTASKSPGQDIAFYLRDSSSNLVTITLGQIITYSGYSTTFTINETKNLMFYAYCNASGISLNNLVIQVQLEKGSNASTYEPYQGNTYNIDLPVENLWGGFSNSFSRSDLGVQFTANQDGTITANGTATNTATSILLSEATSNGIYKTLQKGTYTVSGGGAKYTIEVYDKNNVVRLAGIAPNSSSVSFTISDTTNVVLRVQVASGVTINETIKLQLEKSSKANSYTPYGTTPMELCKIGNYQDYIYKDSGKWYLHKEIGKVVLNGSETWQVHGSLASWFYVDNLIYSVSANTRNDFMLSNYFVQDAYMNATSITNGKMVYSYQVGGGPARLVLKDTDYTTVADFKTWLSTHNVVVYYVLATPVNTALEDM